MLFCDPSRSQTLLNLFVVTEILISIVVAQPSDLQYYITITVSQGASQFSLPKSSVSSQQKSTLQLVQLKTKNMFFIPGHTTNALELQGEDEFCCTASKWTAVNQKKKEQRVKEPALADGR